MKIICLFKYLLITLSFDVAELLLTLFVVFVTVVLVPLKVVVMVLIFVADHIVFSCGIYKLTCGSWSW